MNSTEDYLEQLLSAALNGGKDSKKNAVAANATEKIENSSLTTETDIKEPEAAMPEADFVVNEDSEMNQRSVSEATMEEPADKEFAIKEPAITEPAIEKTIIEEPDFKEPVIEEPATEESATEEPAIEEAPAEAALPDAAISETPAAADDDPVADTDRRMTPEEIEALLASIDLDEDEPDPDEDQVSAIIEGLRASADSKNKMHKKINIENVEALIEESGRQTYNDIPVNVVEVNYDDSLDKNNADYSDDSDTAEESYADDFSGADEVTDADADRLIESGEIVTENEPADIDEFVEEGEATIENEPADIDEFVEEGEGAAENDVTNIAEFVEEGEAAIENESADIAEFVEEGETAAEIDDALSIEMQSDELMTAYDEQAVLEESSSDGDINTNINFDISSDADTMSEEELFKQNMEHSGKEHLNDDSMSPDDIAALLASMGAIDEEPAATEEPIIAEEPAAIEEPIIAEEPVAPVISDDPNKMMSPDDIAALLAAMGNDEEASAEVSEEEPAEEPIATEENAAVEEPIATEETAAVEEPEIYEEPTFAEEPVAPVISDDPNKMMSPDDIAALLAAMGNDEEASAAVSEEEPAEEPIATEETATVEEPEIYEEPTFAEEPAAPVISDDPNKMMSPDDIAALLAAMGNDEEAPAPVEPEPDSEAEALAESLALDIPDVSDEADDPNKMMSPDEIAALVSQMGSDDETPADVHDLSEEQIEEQSDDLMSLLMEGGQQATEKDLIPEENLMPEGDFSEEDIEAKLAWAADVGDDHPIDDAMDVTELLAGSDDEELSEIGDVLKKADNDLLVDESLSDKYDRAEAEGADASAEEESGKKHKKKSKGLLAKLFGKKDKANIDEAENPDGENASAGVEDIAEANAENAGAKSEAENADAKTKAEKTEKKPGFFTKLLNALTEEVPEEVVVPEEAETKLSNENKAILSEMDAEDEEEGGKKGKKGKKDKKPKEKKAKDKKPKKEKPKKEKLKDPKDESKKIPKKYITATAILAISIFVAILLISSYLPKLINLSQARNAYYNKDYQEAFFTMYGKDLNESDQLIYDRSKLIVILEKKYEAYENYSAMNLKEAALDALFTGLEKYENIIDKGIELGVEEELNAVRDKMLAALMNDFGVDEAEAMEVLTYDDLDYTVKLKSILNNTPFVTPKEEIYSQYGVDGYGASESSNENTDAHENGDLEFEDLLPEEQEYLNEKNDSEGENL